MIGMGLFLLQSGAGGAASGGGGGAMSLLAWGVVLLSVAAVLLFVEMIVPSGGLIAVAAAIAAVGGLVCLFIEDTTLGLLTTLAVLIASPFILGFMLKMWPHTPMGRMLILRNPAPGSDEDEGSPQRKKTGDQPALPAVGTTGQAHTRLRPVGTCVFDGKRVECLADGGMIDAGTAVRIVGVEGHEVRVQKTKS